MSIDLHRLRTGELLALPAALLLAVSPFLPWFDVAGVRRDAWQTVPAVAAVAVLAALLALALSGATVAQRSPAVPLALAVASTLVALAATVLVAVCAVAPPAAATARCYALWLGLAGALGVLVAAWLSLRDERPFRGVGVTR